MKFPEELFVRMERDEEEGKEIFFPLAYDIKEEAVNGDGPTSVGVYKLYSVETLKKVVVTWRIEKESNKMDKNTEDLDEKTYSERRKNRTD